MPGIHHTAIVTADVDASMRFWRDGLGLAELFDYTFTGDWPTLFGAATDQLRSIFLGDPETPETGIVELVVLDRAREERKDISTETAPPPTDVPGSDSSCCRCSATSTRRWSRWPASASTTGCAGSRCPRRAGRGSQWQWSTHPTVSGSN